MISETSFANGFTSFWKSITPNSDRVVRKLNLATKRIDLPVGYSSAPDRRGFINEAGFILFKRTFDGTKIRMPRKRVELKAEIFEEARQFVAKFQGVDQETLEDPSVAEWKEIRLLADTIEMFVADIRSNGDEIFVSPYFSGCGFLSGCHGDLIIGKNLVEIKGGDRSFRATDIRQLLTYCSLNSLSNDFPIDKVGCLNPRKGIYFFIELETLSLEMASKSCSELFSEIIYLSSSGDISR